MNSQPMGVMNNEVTQGVWLDLFHGYADLRSNFKDPNSVGYKQWTRLYGVRELPSRLANLPNEVKHKQQQKKLVAMVVNPDIHCGIREHTSYFSSRVETPILTVSQDPRAKSFDDVIQQCLDAQVSIAHIQHEFSLFLDTDAFTELLKGFQKNNIRCVLDFHTGSPDPAGTEKMLVWGRLASAVVTHTNVVSIMLNSLNPIQVPLAIHDDCLWAPEADKIVAIEREKLASTIIIGAVGFHNEHKGFYQLAQAMGLIRRKFADTKLLIIGSHSFPWQDLSFQKVKRASELGTSLLIDRFMPIPEVVRTLAVCDVVVLPYRIHSRSQSGAVETALLSGRPVITSQSQMFDHIPTDHTLCRMSPDVSVKTMGETLRDVIYPQPDCVRLSRSRLAERRGSTIAKRYDELYKKLLV